MMSLYDIHKNNYRKGLVQFVGNFMFTLGPEKNKPDSFSAISDCGRVPVETGYGRSMPW